MQTLWLTFHTSNYNCVVEKAYVGSKTIWYTRIYDNGNTDEIQALTYDWPCCFQSIFRNNSVIPCRKPHKQNSFRQVDDGLGRHFA